jgi:hypothetical protein
MGEGYFNTLNVMETFMREVMKIVIMRGDISYGKKRG